jgi:nucleoid DNA-binding protein
VGTIRREDLMREVSRQCGISQRLATRTVNAILLAIVSELHPWLQLGLLPKSFWAQVKRKRQGRVELRGFGTFSLHASPRVPFHSAILQRQVLGRGGLRIRIRPSRELRERLNGRVDGSHYRPAKTKRRSLGREPWAPTHGD